MKKIVYIKSIAHDHNESLMIINQIMKLNFKENYFPFYRKLKLLPGLQVLLYSTYIKQGWHMTIQKLPRNLAYDSTWTMPCTRQAGPTQNDTRHHNEKLETNT